MTMDINTNIRTTVPVATEQPGMRVQQRQAPPSVKENRTELTTPQQQNKTYTAVAAPEQKEKKASEDLDQVVQKMNTYVQNIQRDLQFSVDEESGRNVVKVIDSKSKEVIRQIPSEEVLALARQWAEQHADDAGFNLLKTSA
jgi:flagellar protein FlaG